MIARMWCWLFRHKWVDVHYTEGLGCSVKLSRCSRCGEHRVVVVRLLNVASINQALFDMHDELVDEVFRPKPLLDAIFGGRRIDDRSNRR